MNRDRKRTQSAANDRHLYQPTTPRIVGLTDPGLSGKRLAMNPQSALDPKDAHVLVAENNVEIYVVIARMLAYMGVRRCEWKPPGWDVVEFAAAMPRVDLILMDIDAFPKGGQVVLNNIRSYASLKSTRVVAMTSTGGIEALSKAMALGFDGHLHMPLAPDKFPGQIRQVLSGDPVWDLGPSSRPE